jgi:hypothetical protein
MNRLVLPAILFALLLLCGCAGPPAHPVLLGGRVWTGEADAWPPAMTIFRATSRFSLVCRAR